LMRAGRSALSYVESVLTFLNRMLRAANSSSLSNVNPENKRRDLIVMGALIEHPQAGLLLFETGCAENVDIVSGKSTALE
jgi:hypothetical protein